MIGVVVGGFGVLFALTVLIGMALDREERSAAWKKIAAARRMNAEQVRDAEEGKARLAALELDLAARERLLVLRERVLVEREARLRSAETDD